MQGNPMVVNFGVPGQTLTQMLADFDTQIAPLVSAGDFTQVFLVCEGGYNDTAGTNAQMQASITSYGAKVAALSAPGVKITRILCTNAPGVNADNTKLATDNAWRRLNYKAIGFDFLADLASDPRLSDYSNTTFVSPDQIHNNDAGSSVIVENVIDCLKPVNADVRSGVSNGFGPVGMLDLPAVGNVRSGITFDGATKTGTLDITADNPPPAIGLTRGFGS
jgi:hypothetical protein